MDQWTFERYRTLGRVPRRYLMLALHRSSTVHGSVQCSVELDSEVGGAGDWDCERLVRGSEIRRLARHGTSTFSLQIIFTVYTKRALAGGAMSTSTEM